MLKLKKGIIAYSLGKTSSVTTISFKLFATNFNSKIKEYIYNKFISNIFIKTI